MTSFDPTIRVAVDPTNPGQFFACCGLFELADRMWGGAEAWFEQTQFCVAASSEKSGCSLTKLLAAIRAATLVIVEPENEMTTPLRLSSPFDLQLDWWNDDRSGGSQLKTWAGQQKVVRIARAMHATLGDAALTSETLFNSLAVLFDSDVPSETVQPFYFDARRGAQADSVDIGFSPDAQKMKTAVYAAVEFLCLVGLQRFRPSSADDDGIRSYRAWHVPLLPSAAAAVIAGRADMPQLSEFRFRLLFRTKYLKGFLTAFPTRGDL